jgi:hypothetical protein
LQIPTASFPKPSLLGYFPTTNSIEIMAHQNERLYCWTVCAYRKPDISEEDYHSYMSNFYAPLVKELAVKYGIIDWVMVISRIPPKSPVVRLTSAPCAKDP